MFYEDYDQCMPDSLLSNMSNEDKPLVMKAAKDSGFGSIVYIRDAFYGRYHDIPYPGNFGLHTSRRGVNHSPFWRAFEKCRGQWEALSKMFPVRGLRN